MPKAPSNSNSRTKSPKAPAGHQPGANTGTNNKRSSESLTSTSTSTSDDDRQQRDRNRAQRRRDRLKASLQRLTNSMAVLPRGNSQAVDGSSPESLASSLAREQLIRLMAENKALTTQVELLTGIVTGMITGTVSTGTVSVQHRTFGGSTAGSRRHTEESIEWGADRERSTEPGRFFDSQYLSPGYLASNVFNSGQFDAPVSVSEFPSFSTSPPEFRYLRKPLVPESSVLGQRISYNRASNNAPDAGPSDPTTWAMPEKPFSLGYSSLPYSSNGQNGISQEDNDWSYRN